MHPRNVLRCVNRVLGSSSFAIRLLEKASAYAVFSNTAGTAEVNNRPVLHRTYLMSHMLAKEEFL